MFAQATFRQCDFEKYGSGCFASANLVCDIDTLMCKCTQDAPILIDDRYCLKKCKENEICQHNKQCDNSKGIYCSFSDYKQVSDTSYPNYADNFPQEKPRCRNISKEYLEEHKHLPTTFKSTAKGSSQSQQYNINFEKNYSNNNSKKSNHGPTTSIFSYLQRIIWLILLGSIVFLIILLILIKTQFYRVGRSFQDQTEDRLSINSELEEPPPYEIAIRMKL